MKSKRILLVIGLLAFLATAVAFKIPHFGNIVGGAGALVATKALAPQINRAVNTVTGNNHLSTRDATKVVPIVSAGDGVSVGAAQVTGPSGAVANTKAVAQLELKYGTVRGKVLIPVNSTNPAKFHRVQGVGVSAVIDVRLSL